MKRIKTIVNLIHRCRCVYDVGSDHAFLSILILKNKIAEHVVNIENKINPLNNGKKNLQKNHLIDKTTNIINDGLKNITKKVKIKPNYIVVAGVGGATTVKILKTCRLMKKKITFILCPNLQTHILRKWLKENNFSIEKEQTIFDKKFYQIIVAKQKNTNSTINEKYLYFGQKNKQLDLLTWKKYLSFNEKMIVKNEKLLYNKQYQKMLKEIALWK